MLDLSSAAQSENCLHLDLYLPITTDDNSAKAIVFNIHGGSYQIGSKTNYDGRVFAAVGDVIVVSANYRLGGFGYLLTPEQGEDNVGEWDQHLAIKWTRENAAAFGGDPERLTIMGESAGGFSVAHHLLSEEVLFSGAIIQSGVVLDPYTGFSRKRALETWKRYESVLECQSEKTSEEEANREVMRCMRGMDAFELRDRVFRERITTWPLVEDDSLLSGASSEGRTLPSSILDSGGVDRSVRVMAGWCSDEGSLFPHFARTAPLAMSDAIYDGYFDAFGQALGKGLSAFIDPESNSTDFDTLIQSLRWLYRQERTDYWPSTEVLDSGATLEEIRNYRRFMDYFGDFLITIPTILFAERLRATGSTVFLYELDQDSNGTLADFYPHPFPYDGSSHTDDIMSVMNHN